MQHKLTEWESFITYIGGSIIQIILDNPITAYRQLIQQYAKDSTGNIIDPKIARQEANKVFIKLPVTTSLSGLTPRLLGASIKSIPKFGSLWLVTALTNQNENNKKEPTIIAAISSSIFSAYIINN